MELTPTPYRLSNGNTLYCFPSGALDIIKLDFTFEAGSAYQPTKLCAHAANKLFSEASSRYSVEEISEFFDYRGIAVEQTIDTFTGSFSVYSLRRYAEELFPLLAEIIQHPIFPQGEFEVYCNKRRQQLLSNFQKTNFLARNLFYEALYGKEHPLGSFATVEDLEKLTLEDVRNFYTQRYQLSDAYLVLGGCCDEALLKSFDEHFGRVERVGSSVRMEVQQPEPQPQRRIHKAMPNSVQSTIRVGRLLPFGWDDPRYAQFMVLSTVLGGYFGSRLMSNVREDKGYTYGIYSQTQIYRGSIAFYITSEVGNNVVEPALKEIYHEISRLQNELVGEEELDIVRHYMEGDFVRSVDGIFECSERYRQMVATDVDERFTDLYFNALKTVTPEQLRELARQVLAQEELVEVVVGN